MGRISWWEGIPGVKDFLVGYGIPSGKDFLVVVGRNSQWEGIPDRREIPGDLRISRWKDFLVGKMFTFITRSFLGQPKSKNHRNLSPAAGIYWLIKLSVLSLSHEILLKIHKKLPSMLAFITRLFLGQPKSKNHRNLSPAAGIYWLIKLSALSLNHKIPVSKILENCFRC